MIADAEASDLPREYCSSTMIQFLVRVLQLSPGEAAARVRAAAAVGSRTSMLGEAWTLCCRGWPHCNATVSVNAEKVRLWSGPCTNSPATTWTRQAVQTAEQLLTDHAPILAPPELRRFAHAVVNAADPDGPRTGR